MVNGLYPDQGQRSVFARWGILICFCRLLVVFKIITFRTTTITSVKQFRSRSGLTGSANTVLLNKNNRLQSLSADDTNLKWAFFELELRGLINC